MRTTYINKTNVALFIQLLLLLLQSILLVFIYCDFGNMTCGFTDMLDFGFVFCLASSVLSLVCFIAGLFNSSTKRKWSMIGILVGHLGIAFLTVCVIVLVAIGKS